MHFAFQSLLHPHHWLLTACRRWIIPLYCRPTLAQPQMVTTQYSTKALVISNPKLSWETTEVFPVLPNWIICLVSRLYPMRCLKRRLTCARSISLFWRGSNQGWQRTEVKLNSGTVRHTYNGSVLETKKDLHNFPSTLYKLALFQANSTRVDFCNIYLFSFYLV